MDRVQEKETKVVPELKHFEIVTGPLAKEMLEGFGAMESQFGDYRIEFSGFTGEFRNYRGEFQGFAQSTNENFKTLDSKYGEISQKTDSDSLTSFELRIAKP